MKTVYYMDKFKNTEISIVCKTKKELKSFIKDCKRSKLRFKAESKCIKYTIFKSYSWLFPDPICFAYNYGLDKDRVVASTDVNFFDNTIPVDYSSFGRTRYNV